MSNLSTALAALQAEITYAKEGLSYYSERVKTLEQALAAVVLVDQGGRQASKSSTASQGRGKGKRKSKMSAASGTVASVSLPSTGGDYWKNLLAAEPKSAPEILSAAINQLGFTPTKQQAGQLRNRLTFALNTMVKAGNIQDSGAGRERRFFLK